MVAAKSNAQPPAEMPLDHPVPLIAAPPVTVTCLLTGAIGTGRKGDLCILFAHLGMEPASITGTITDQFQSVRKPANAQLS